MGEMLNFRVCLTLQVPKHHFGLIPILPAWKTYPHIFHLGQSKSLANHTPQKNKNMNMKKTIQ